MRSIVTRSDHAGSTCMTGVITPESFSQGGKVYDQMTDELAVDTIKLDKLVGRGPEFVIDPVQLDESHAPAVWERDIIEESLGDLGPEGIRNTLGFLDKESWNNIHGFFIRRFRADLATCSTPEQVRMLYPMMRAHDTEMAKAAYAVTCNTYSELREDIHKRLGDIEDLAKRKLASCPKPSQFIASGRFRKIVIDGITHIQLVKEEVHV